MNRSVAPCGRKKTPRTPRDAGRIKMTVSTVLASKGREVVTIEPTASLSAAAGLLGEKRIRAVVILGADHRIIGILSERDIVRALAERGPTALNERVSQVMTRDVKTCT